MVVKVVIDESSFSGMNEIGSQTSQRCFMVNGSKESKWYDDGNCDRSVFIVRVWNAGDFR
jgi:hypothetical protein